MCHELGNILAYGTCMALHRQKSSVHSSLNLFLLSDLGLDGLDSSLHNGEDSMRGLGHSSCSLRFYGHFCACGMGLHGTSVGDRAHCRLRAFLRRE